MGFFSRKALASASEVSVTAGGPAFFTMNSTSSSAERPP